MSLFNCPGCNKPYYECICKKKKDKKEDKKEDKPKRNYTPKTDKLEKRIREIEEQLKLLTDKHKLPDSVKRSLILLLNSEKSKWGNGKSKSMIEHAKNVGDYFGIN